MHLTSISPETRRIVPECPRSPTASHWTRTFPHFPPANNGSKKSKSGDNTHQMPEVTQLWSIGTWWLGNSVRRPPERSKKKQSVRSGGAAGGWVRRSCASVLLTTRKSCDQLGEARGRGSSGPHSYAPLTHLEASMAHSDGSDAHGRHLRVKCVAAGDSLTGKTIPTVVFNLEQ